MRWLFFILLTGCGEQPAPDAPRPPPGELSMEIGALRPGHTSPLIARGADEAERVWFVRSFAGEGSGPCPAAIGGACLGILQPQVSGSATADTIGVATLDLSVPATAPVGAEICFQAAVLRSGGASTELSEPVCATVQDPDPCLSSTTGLVLGTGVSSVVELVPEQDLSMVRGGQGGWHMPLAFLATNAPAVVTLEVDMFDLDAGGASVSFGNPQRISLPLQPTPGAGTCDGQYTDIVAFLDFSQVGTSMSDYQSVCGHRLQIDMVLREYVFGSLGGPLARQTTVVVAQPDPIDGPPCN